MFEFITGIGLTVLAVGLYNTRKDLEMVSEKLDAALGSIAEIAALIEDAGGDIAALMAAVEELRGQVLDPAAAAKIDEVAAGLVALRDRLASVAGVFPPAPPSE